MKTKIDIIGIDNSVKSSDIKKFFHNVRIKFISNIKNRRRTIEINSEDVDNALAKNGCTFKLKPVKVRIHVEKEELEANNVSFPVINENDAKDKINDTGRLFIRNLDFDVTEEDVVELFKSFGDLAEVHVPYDLNLKRNKGIAYVTYFMPKDACKAYNAVNRTKLKKRKIHIIPSDEKPDKKNPSDETKTDEDTGDFKEKKKLELLSQANSAHNWNAFFVNSDSSAEYLAEVINVSKANLYGSNTIVGSVSVKKAQAGIQLVQEIRQFFDDNNVNLDVLDKLANVGQRDRKTTANVSWGLSSTTFIVKNLPYRTSEDEIREGIFGKFPGLVQIQMAPYGVTAIVTYELSQQAKVAYFSTANTKFRDTLLMLQWAPIRVKSEQSDVNQSETPVKTEPEKKTKRKKSKSTETNLDSNEINQGISNNDKNPIKTKEQSCDKTIINTGNKRKISESDSTEQLSKKSRVVEEVQKEQEKLSKKIIVKNISFQSTQVELEELFRDFNGFIRIRLPKKPNGSHKGYGFVEFESEDDAEVVMDALKVSTHLLGRRLVLEYSYDP